LARELLSHLDERWAGWFEYLTITQLPGGKTRLSGNIVDEAALHGLLNRIHHLSLHLLYLIRGDFHDEEANYSQTS
jgi:hypothetical protein